MYFILFLVIHFEIEERERETDLFFYLFMHTLFASCMCPDLEHSKLVYQDSTKQTELPSQGLYLILTVIVLITVFFPLTFYLLFIFLFNRINMQLKRVQH